MRLITGDRSYVRGEYLRELPDGDEELALDLISGTLFYRYLMLGAGTFWMSDTHVH